MWTVEEVSDSGVSGSEIREYIHGLASNDLAAVRVPDIYQSDEIDEIVENIERQGVLWYPNFEFMQGRIGISATEYTSKINGKEAYFLLEAEASKIRDRLFPEQLDPVGKMIDVFSSGFDVSIAQEPALGNANYFTGLVRAMGRRSTTHFDFAPQQLPGWQVAESEAQFAVVTYLQVPGEGGEITVYNRPWNETDEKHNQDVEEKGPQGFEKDFLEGTESVSIAPNPGEMVVFNSRNFHKVEDIVSEIARYSINSFMGLSDNKLLLWN